MTKSKSDNKKANWIISLIIFIFLCATGYYSIDYFQETDNNVKLAYSENIQTTNSLELLNDNLNIIFFYVGQADSTFIKLNDTTMLIDAGNNGDGIKVAKFLKDNGIMHLDYLIGTHADEDHIGGIDDIIKELEVEKLYIPTVGNDSKNYKNMVEAANNKNVPIENPVRGDEFYLGEAKCEVMSAMEGEEVSDNNSSIVLQMVYKQTSYLFMGDGEKEVENSRQWNKVDVLKVGHHGSNSSSSKQFLSQVKPKYSIIEVGKDNSYNLPNSKAIERLQNIGTQILRTDKAKGDEVGSFWLTSDGNSIDIKTVDINLDGNP